MMALVYGRLPFDSHTTTPTHVHALPPHEQFALPTHSTITTSLGVLARWRMHTRGLLTPPCVEGAITPSQQQPLSSTPPSTLRYPPPAHEHTTTAHARLPRASCLPGGPISPLLLGSTSQPLQSPAYPRPSSLPPPPGTLPRPSTTTPRPGTHDSPLLSSLLSSLPP